MRDGLVKRGAPKKRTKIEMKGRKGYIIVFTGDGKGKTTAALGMAMRATGHGFRVLMVQFLKGTNVYGELTTAKLFGDKFQISQMGRNSFVHVDPFAPDQADVAAADRAWEYAQAKIVSGQYDMIILDEINNAVDYGLLPVEKILNMLKKKPDGTTVVLTGRKAHDSIVKVADLVTEMREIKHPYRKGKKARKGIEF